MGSNPTRSAINGSNFGDNIKAGLPDVIGQTIGRALGGALRGPARANIPIAALADGNRSLASTGPVEVLDLPAININPVETGGVTQGEVVAGALRAASNPASSLTILPGPLAQELALGNSRIAAIAARQNVWTSLNPENDFDLTIATGQFSSVEVEFSEEIKAAYAAAWSGGLRFADPATVQAEVSKIVGRDVQPFNEEQIAYIRDTANNLDPIPLASFLELQENPWYSQALGSFSDTSIGVVTLTAFGVDHGGAFDALYRKNPTAAAIGEYGGLVFGLAGALKGTLKAFSKELIEEAAERGGPKVVAEFPEGSFSISNWSNYPAGIPKPTGPFRLLEGEEFDAARKAADNANRALHRADPAFDGFQLHEIQPVKFGGSPTDPLNKVPLTQAEHTPVTNWWNQLQRNLEGK